MKLCQNHNISGENLFYRWEAVKFNRGPSSGQFSSDDVQELRKAIQRDVAKANVGKKFARGNLSGLQSRNFGSTPVKSGARPAANGAMGTPIKPMVRPQDGFDLSRVEEKVAPVAGPSRVTFVGPSTGEEERKKRACESNLLPTPEDMVPTIIQTDTCMRRSQSGAKVSMSLYIYMLSV